MCSRNLAPNGFSMFFNGSTSTSTPGPWFTDGTSAGTRALADATGNYPAYPQWIGAVHGTAVMVGYDNSATLEYWKSDGSSQGTTLIGPVAPQSPGLSSSAAVGNHLLFMASEAATGTELYALQGSVVATTTQLTATPTEAVSASTVVLTATVAATKEGEHPNGTVSFSDGKTQLGTVSPADSGTATYSTTTLSIGTHSIRATYDGDSYSAVSTSPAVSVAVDAPAPPVVVTPSPSAGGQDSGKGGGGATGLYELIALSLLLGARPLRRRQ